MTKQGWTLFEMVLTIALVGVLVGVLLLSLSKPIQDFFWLQKRQDLLLPILLSSESIGQAIPKQAKGLKYDNNQVQIDTITLDCDHQRLKASGIVIQFSEPMGCTVNTIESSLGWIIQLHLYSLQDETYGVERLYFVRGVTDAI